MIRIGDIKVYADPYCAKEYNDGRPRLFTLVSARLTEDGAPLVLVHPDRWDEFFMAINRHPDARQLLGLTANR